MLCLCVIICVNESHVKYKFPFIKTLLWKVRTNQKVSYPTFMILVIGKQNGAYIEASNSVNSCRQFLLFIPIKCT